MEYTFAELERDWARKIDGYMDTLVRQSANDATAGIPIKPGIMRGYERTPGSIPRDTGQLANSQVSSIDGSVSKSGKSAHSFVAGTMVAGDVGHFGWTAEYAWVQHYGGNGIEGTGWITAVANRWPQIVNDNLARIIKGS